MKGKNILKSLLIVLAIAGLFSIVLGNNKDKIFNFRTLN